MPVSVPPRLREWSQKVKVHIFQNTEINENHECSNVVANILPADPPPPTPVPRPCGLDQEVKNQFFQYMVMLLIKLKRNILVAHYPPPPLPP